MDFGTLQGLVGGCGGHLWMTLQPEGELVAKIRLPLLVFPEGTTARSAALLPFRVGAFAAAVETEAPIVPITIAGTRSILPRGTWVLRRGPVRVIVHRPIRPRTSGWSETIRLRDEAKQGIDAQRSVLF